MRAEPDNPSLCPLRDSTIRIVLDRLQSVEFTSPVPARRSADTPRDELAARRVMNRPA